MVIALGSFTIHNSIASLVLDRKQDTATLASVRLEEHALGVLHVTLEGSEPLSADSAVDHTVIAGKGNRHNVLLLEGVSRLKRVVHNDHRSLLGGANLAGVRCRSQYGNGGRLLTARMHAWGGLIMAEKLLTPNIPRLEMVKVPPCSVLTT